MLIKVQTKLEGEVESQPLEVARQLTLRSWDVNLSGLCDAVNPDLKTQPQNFYLYKRFNGF